MEVNNLQFQIVLIIFLDYHNWRLHAKFQSSTIIFKTKYFKKVAKKRKMTKIQGVPGKSGF